MKGMEGSHVSLLSFHSFHSFLSFSRSMSGLAARSRMVSPRAPQIAQEKDEME